MNKPNKKQQARALVVASSVAAFMRMEEVPVQGASIAVMTAAWLVLIHPDDRLPALAHLHKTVINMAAEMEQKIEAEMAKEKK